MPNAPEGALALFVFNETALGSVGEVEVRSPGRPFVRGASSHKTLGCFGQIEKTPLNSISVQYQGLLFLRSATGVAPASQ